MKIPTWQKFNQFETILVSKKDRPMVKFVLLFPFGADRDPVEKQGLTNIVGDLLLRGCASYTRTQLEDKLDELGASLNVFTGFHSVSIEGAILKRNFPELVRIVQEILSSPTFEEAELEHLRQETIAQLRMRLDDDQGLAKSAFNRQMYQDHTYAREVVGNAQTLNKITIDDVKKHFATYFTQNDVKIGLSGDVSNAMIDLCAMTITRCLPDTKVETLTMPAAVQCKGKTLVFVNKPDRSQTHFFIGHPTLPLTDQHAYDFLIFKTAFSGSLFQAKYMQEIRVKRGWSYGAYGSTDHRRWASMYYLYTFPKNDDTADAIATSLDLYQSAKNGSLLEKQDIDFAKHYLYKSFPFKIDTPGKILSQKIHHKLLGLPEDYIESFRHNVESVSADGISERIQDYFTDNDMVISVLGTKDQILSNIEEKIKPDHTIIVDYESLI